MRLGVNWTSPHNAHLVKALCQTGDVDFCELLIDNFLLYEPEEVREVIPAAECSFHIMHSHFLHREIKELETYAFRIRKFIDVLKPDYVSDHIGVFVHGHRQLPFMQEVIYKDFFPFFRERALLWGDLLESFMYYENFPSFQGQACRQIEFYALIQEELGPYLNVLFDVSNAVVAEKNGCESASSWRQIAERTPHYHVGSYQKAGDTPYYLDSHDRPISAETLDFLKSLPLNHKTLVVERDFNLEFQEWHQDIQNIGKVVRDVCAH